MTGIISGVLFGLILFFPAAPQSVTELLWTIIGLGGASAGMALFALVSCRRYQLRSVLWSTIANGLLTTGLTVVILDILQPPGGVAVILGLLIGLLVGTAVGWFLCKFCGDQIADRSFS